MVLRRREKKEQRREGREPRPPKEKPDHAAPDTAPTSLAALRGTVRTLRPTGNREPYGIPWSNVTRFEPAFTDAGKEFGVEPLLMAAMAVVETDANHYRPGTLEVIARDDGFGDGVSVGVMQVKPRIWQDLVPNADPDTPVGNIRLGTAIMAYAMGKHGTWEKALTTTYFPTDDPNGTTQNAYVITVRSLMAEMRNQLKPVEQPQTMPGPHDPIRAIVGGNYPPITYGWLADAGLNYYGYGVGHGTQRATQHTGVDVGVPDETPLYVPVAGKVLCVGQRGNNTWGQGCGAYADTTGGGVGNITILLDSGHKLTLGHCSSAVVQPGQRVAAGQRVGKSGGMNGPHVHVEVAVERNGTYWLVDPIPALKEAMGGTPVPAPLDTVPYQWDHPQRNVFVVHSANAVAARQRADPNAKVLYIVKPNQPFEAVALIPGNDGFDWWLATDGARIPFSGSDWSVKVG